MVLHKHPNETNGNKLLAGKLTNGWPSSTDNLKIEITATTKNEQSLTRMNRNPSVKESTARASVPAPTDKTFSVKPKGKENQINKKPNRKKKLSVQDRIMKSFKRYKQSKR